MHIFLSPHLDDVVLSCGAIIARLHNQGETVIILTVMAGEPPPDVPDTPVVRALREKFEGVNKAVLTRRKEDVQAAMCLGVKVYHLWLLECCFRTARAPDGLLPLYPSDESQFGPVHPADDARISLLSMPLPFQGEVKAIYAPLAVSNHVDHQIVRDWALVLSGAYPPARLHFYGEYPDVLNATTLAKALRYYTDELPALKLIPEMVRLETDEVENKMAALRCYASRILMPWDSLVEMETGVRSWMKQGTDGAPVERLWHVVKQTGLLGPA